MSNSTDNESFLNSSIANYNAIIQIEKQKKDKLDSFKKRIEPFQMVSTLEEAKELADKILPTSNEINRFYVGDAKCTIVNRVDLLRISIDSPEEYICYDFT